MMRLTGAPWTGMFAEERCIFWIIINTSCQLNTNNFIIGFIRTQSFPECSASQDSESGYFTHRTNIQ